MTLFIVNGHVAEVQVDRRESLLEVLRERLGLFGAEDGCDQRHCDACLVHLGGRRVLCCLTLALQADGREVRSIEGFAADGTLHPLRQAVIDHDALQAPRARLTVRE